MTLEGLEPSSTKVKISGLNHLDNKAYLLHISLTHIDKAQCKYRTCFSWLQNSYITFMLTGRIASKLL